MCLCYFFFTHHFNSDSRSGARNTLTDKNCVWFWLLAHVSKYVQAWVQTLPGSAADVNEAYFQWRWCHFKLHDESKYFTVHVCISSVNWKHCFWCYLHWFFGAFQEDIFVAFGGEGGRRCFLGAETAVMSRTELPATNSQCMAANFYIFKDQHNSVFPRLFVILESVSAERLDAALQNKQSETLALIGSPPSQSPPATRRRITKWLPQLVCCRSLDLLSFFVSNLVWGTWRETRHRI